MQRIAEGVVRLLFTSRFMAIMWERFKYCKHIHNIQLKASFMCIKIKYLWKRRMKRLGPTFWEIRRRRIRNILTVRHVVLN